MGVGGLHVSKEKGDIKKERVWEKKGVADTHFRTMLTKF